jgi:ubiquinone biosynthesis protein UbiJ
MASPSLHTAACIALEKTIATALHYDPASRLAIARLSGKVLAVEFNQPSMVFYFVPHNTGLNIQAYFEGSVTTRIKGSPLALAGLMNSSRVNLADSGVEVFGSTGLLIELQSILKNLDIDWEQALSEVIGDVLGHETAKAIRTALGWAQQRKNNFKR